MNVKFALTGLVVAVFSVPAFAQSTDTKSTPRIDQRQEKQETRIEQGAKSGQLTGKETTKLEKGQVKVQKMDSTDGMNEMREVGRAIAGRKVRAEHFARFT